MKTMNPFDLKNSYLILGLVTSCYGRITVPMLDTCMLLAEMRVHEHWLTQLSKATRVSIVVQKTTNVVLGSKMLEHNHCR